MFLHSRFSNKGFSAILLVVVIVLVAIIIGLTTAKRGNSPQEPVLNLKQSVPPAPDGSGKVKVNVNWVQLNENVNEQSSNLNASTPQTPRNTNQPTPPSSQSNKVTFALTARQWEFEPSVVRVKFGDEVTLNITSVDVLHGFGLPDFGVSQNLEPGKTTVVKFTANKKGTFSFFCSVFCGEGHKEMKGTLIVE